MRRIPCARVGNLLHEPRDRLQVPIATVCTFAPWGTSLIILHPHEHAR